MSISLDQIYKILLFLVLFGIFKSGFAQQPPSFTQHLNNHILVNPAFAGNRNALAIDLLSRQQWLGIKGAPSTYYFSMHSPINLTKASIGCYLLRDVAGPVTRNSLVGTYSHLSRLSHNAFLSLGLNVGLDNHWIGLNNLYVIDQNDPHFSGNIENKFKPIIGSGFVVFTPTLYFGFSVPQLIPSKLNLPSSKNSTLNFGYNTYFSAGVKIYSSNEFMVKAAHLSRFSQYYNNNYDFSLQFYYKSLANIAVNYQLNNSMAVIVGAQLTKQMELTYSYDFAISNNKLQTLSNQELTLSFSISSFYIRNRDREFLKKGKVENESLRSIRHF